MAAAKENWTIKQIIKTDRPQAVCKKITHCLDFAWLSYYGCRRHITDVDKDNKVCTLDAHLLTQSG